MIAVLGIDPGASGGAVLLDATGGRSLAAVGWRKCQHQNAEAIRLVTVTEGGAARAETLVQTLHQVGAALAGFVAPLRYGLCVEGLFAPFPPAGMVCRYGSPQQYAYMGRLRNVVTLAESTGQIAGPVQSGAVATYRPKASDWRPEVLRIRPKAPSEEAERAAIDAMQGPRPRVAGLGELAEDPHVAEAACLALFGWGRLRLETRARRARR